MNAENLEALSANIDDAFFLIGGAILLIEIAEGWFKGTLKRRAIADMFASISTQIPYLFVEIVMLTGAYGLYTVVSENFISWTFPITVWSVVGAVLIADFLYYWEHRIAHEVRILWLQHAVHHSSRYMNISTALRFGPLEGIWSAIITFPMVLAGFSPELIIFGVVTVLAYQTWLHTELIGKLGPIEWVFNTPSHHRVHHGCDEKYLDRNYGGFLIIWDRLFGTFQLEEETPRYGLKRDFNAVNPFAVWFSEFPAFVNDLWNSRSCREVWLCCFGPPGWRPNDGDGSDLYPNK